MERLDVAVLSHSPLLQPVADALTQTLQTLTLRPPRMVYVSNVKARALRKRRRHRVGPGQQHRARCSLVRSSDRPSGVRLHPPHRNAPGPRADQSRKTVHSRGEKYRLGRALTALRSSTGVPRHAVNACCSIVPSVTTENAASSIQCNV